SSRRAVVTVANVAATDTGIGSREQASHECDLLLQYRNGGISRGQLLLEILLHSGDAVGFIRDLRVLGGDLILKRSQAILDQPRRGIGRGGDCIRRGFEKPRGGGAAQELLNGGE